MFKGMGNLLSMLKGFPQMQAKMEELQQKLGSIVAEANAGGGMVTAKVNGRFEVVSCSISDEAFKLNDKEMLEDLIAAAVNQAMAKARQQTAEETQKVFGFELPAGMNIPGLS